MPTLESHHEVSSSSGQGGTRVVGAIKAALPTSSRIESMKVAAACTKCKVGKPAAEFQKRSDRKKGIYSQCKQCRLRYAREYQKSREGKAVHRKYRMSEKGKIVHRRSSRKHAQAHPLKRRARVAIRYQIKTKRLSKLTDSECVFCTDIPIAYHHWNGYENKLDVIPVCRACHRQLHAKG